MLEQLPNQLPKSILDLLEADQIEDPVEREARQFEALDEIAARRGFRLYNRSLTWTSDPEFWDLWRAFPIWQRHRAERKHILWSVCRSVVGIGGATAECGVYLGGGSYLIAKEAERQGSTGTHYAFDSFEGLSEPTKADMPTAQTAHAWNAGELAVSEQQVAENLKDCKHVKTMRGWIPERFDDVRNERFSFVHIDVDLHEPTRDSIEFFFPRLMDGGILLCDDYGSEWCPGAKTAMDDYQRAQGLHPVIDLGTGQGMLIKK